MAIGPEIAPSHPALVRTVRIGTEMGRGVDLAAAPPRGHDVRWRGCGWLWVRGTAVLTGVARRFVGKARKGCGLTVALGPWAWGLRCRRTHDGGVAGPRPLDPRRGGIQRRSSRAGPWGSTDEGPLRHRLPVAGPRALLRGTLVHRRTGGRIALASGHL